MPVYDYRCAGCGRRFQLFFRSFSDVRDPSGCPHCGAADLAKLPPRVRLVRSEESRLDDLADPSTFGDLDESDPGSVARWAKRMGQEMGEDLGDEFDDAIDQMGSGETPGNDEAAGENGGLEDDAGDDL